MQKAYAASKIFTGNEWLSDHTIITSNGKIDKIITTPTKTSSIPVTFYDDCFIVPAFIDVQVYGAAKKLFSLYPEAATLQLMYDEFIKQGTVLFLPTVATNTIKVFKNCIDAVKYYWNINGKGVYGLHLEGPWLNQEKSGAHVKEWIHPPTLQEAKDLLEYGKGIIKMITLAPEKCSTEIVQLIASYNIIVSAGHSNATFEQATNSFNQGISTVTHLYNAMSPLQHRNPGLVGATFNNDKVMASIIADGHHVDYAAVSIAKKQMGERLFAITDAVTETSTGPYQHQLMGDKYECNGVLSGSALSMHKAFLNLVHHAKIEIEEALRMCSLYPAKLLKCDDVYGKVAPQHAAHFLVLNKNLALQEVIIL